MNKLLIEPGQRFGRLTVIEEARLPRSDCTTGLGHRAALCRCDDGNLVTVRVTNLCGTGTRARSCGCLQREQSAEQIRKAFTTHGLRQHPLYKTWLGMMHRCYREKTAKYKYYGGRGIYVCDEWHDVATFITAVEKLPHYGEPGRTLDRYPDNDGPYAPGNVRWATWSEQNLNQRPRATSHG